LESSLQAVGAWGNTLKRELQPASADAKRMEISELTKALVAIGCPPEKSAEMAAQLDKRARQLAAQKGRSYEEALAACRT